MSRTFHPLVMIIIGLAIFGFFFRLIYHPLQLLTQIALYVGVAALIFFLYKRFMQNRYGVGGGKSPQRPSSFQIKKQKKTQKKGNVIPHSRNGQLVKRSTRPLTKRSPSPNLTVIEGKKGKKKNRALF